MKDMEKVEEFLRRLLDILYEANEYEHAMSFKRFQIELLIKDIEEWAGISIREKKND